MQIGNSSELKLCCVLQRDNVHNAKFICDIIRDGLSQHHKRGTWYQIEKKHIKKIFDNIDNIDSDL